MRYRTIALIMMLLPASAYGQGGPDPGKCPLIQASREAFAGARDEATTIAATIGHVERFEGKRAVTAARRQGLTSYIKAIGWQEHVRQSIDDLAAEWRMNRCT